MEAAARLRRDYGAKITMLHVKGPDISSSDIRGRIEQGLPVEGLVCEEVLRYIYQQGLYFPSREEMCIRDRVPVLPASGIPTSPSLRPVPSCMALWSMLVSI